jgi:hypothetical protein
LKVSIKYLEGTKWKELPAEELVGNSVVTYMVNTERIVIAALYENEKAVAFVSNSQEWVDNYKPKGLSLLASELQILLGTEVIPHVLAETIGGNVVEIKTIKPC